MRIVLCECLPETVETITSFLLEEGLAASIQVVKGVQRTYREGNTLQHEEYALLIIHTILEQLQDLMEAIIILHPMAMPGIVTLEVLEANRAFLSWVEQKLSIQTR